MQWQNVGDFQSSKDTALAKSCTSKSTAAKGLLRLWTSCSFSTISRFKFA